jgi:hypothetical protein
MVGQLDEAMVSQVVVTGSLAHHRMATAELVEHVRSAFPTLVPGGTRLNASPQPDFSVQIRDCLTEFFCDSTTSLDFTISVIHSDSESGRQQERAVAATESLVRSCGTILDGLNVSLRRRYSRRKPKLELCIVEDPFSKSTILTRGTVSPLRSAGAKWSFGLAVFWLIIAGILVWWQSRVHQSAESRLTNILTIGLSLGVAAISTPIPIVINWREWKRNPTWRYKGSDR